MILRNLHLQARARLPMMSLRARKFPARIQCTSSLPRKCCSAHAFVRGRAILFILSYPILFPAVLAVASSRTQERSPVCVARRQWAAGFNDLQECPQPLALNFRGRLPKQLQGTYYKTGPARFTLGGQRVSHPFDGDGAVYKIRFKDGAATFQCRFVQTDSFRLSNTTGRRHFPGVFGTQLPGGVLQNALEISCANVANTGVLPFGNKILATMEAGHPWALRPDTLETIGPDTLSDTVPSGLLFTLEPPWLNRLAEAVLSAVRAARGRCPARVSLGGEAVAAHYSLNPSSGYCVVLAYQLKLELPAGHLTTCCRFLEFDRNHQFVGSTPFELDGYGFVHDFKVVDGAVLLIQNPVKLRMLPLVLGMQTPIHCLEFDPHAPLRMHVVPLRGTATGGTDDGANGSGGASVALAEPMTFEFEPAFVTHFANAWLDPDGSRLHLYCICYTTMPDFHGWSGQGRDFLDVDPEQQPPSYMVHFSMPIQSAAEGPEREKASAMSHTLAVGVVTQQSNPGVGMHSWEAGGCCGEEIVSRGGRVADCERHMNKYGSMRMASPDLKLNDITPPEQQGLQEAAVHSSRIHGTLTQMTQQLNQHKAAPGSHSCLDGPQQAAAQMARSMRNTSAPASSMTTRPGQTSLCDSTQPPSHLSCTQQRHSHDGHLDTGGPPAAVSRHPPCHQHCAHAGNSDTQHPRSRLPNIDSQARSVPEACCPGPGQHSWQATSTMQRVSERVMEFPAVHPDTVGLPTRTLYSNCALHEWKNRPPQAIAALQVETGTLEMWSRGWAWYPGEPEVAAMPAAPRTSGSELGNALVEDCERGWLLVVANDEERGVSEIVVLDTSDVAKGPIAAADLPVRVPHALHGVWVPDV